MNILKWLKNWWFDGDINVIDGKDKNSVKENQITEDFVEEKKEISSNVEQFEMTEDVSEVENKNNFFEKISILKLLDSRKSDIAEKIVDDSNPDKLYWIQFILSCMIATLGLLMNSIPVVIWAMLISPILNPIKAFAFAITTWNKHMYLRSIKVILISILLAILSSVFISFIVPFSSLTTEVMSRVSPTMVDLFVALFSWAVAFLSLWFKRLEENIAGVAMSVALLPPLSIIGIWVFFMDFSVAQWSFLLFMANLVAILVIWIIIFYMFWFFPTNKEWKRRSFVILFLVFLSILVVSFPLQKSMSKIADNMKITNKITITSENYLNSLDGNIVLNNINFKNISDDLIRVSAVLNVPSDFVINKEHKSELTKLLSMSTQKSIELDLDIVEILSVYIWEEKTESDLLMEDISTLLSNTFKDVYIIDHRILEQDFDFVFLTLYSDSNIDKKDIYDSILSDVQNVYGTWSKLIIEWQENTLSTKKQKTIEQIDIEKQFNVLFPKSDLNKLEINKLTKNLSWENIEYVYLDIDFVSPQNYIKIKRILEEWKSILKKYFEMDVIINSKVEYFSEFEL